MNSDLNQLVNALTNLINDVLGSRVEALEDKASRRLADVVNIQAMVAALEGRIEGLENADMDHFGTLATSIRDLEARAEVQMEELGRCNHANRSQDGLLAQLLKDNIELRSRLDKLEKKPEKKPDLQEPEPVESSLRSPEAAAALIDLIEENSQLAATICNSETVRETLEEMLEDEIKSNSYLYDKIYDTVRDALRDANVSISI